MKCFVFIVLILLYMTSLCQGILIQPNVFFGRQSCTNNAECLSGCCLVTHLNRRRISGVCQSTGRLGDFCAPGNRLRNFYGSLVYTYSCPCRNGLSCRPLWRRESHGISVMQDPKCIPVVSNRRSPMYS